jgi:hypothetical protein
MYELRNLAQQLRTFSTPLADATPELRDAIILRTWLQHFSLSMPRPGDRIFGPSLTSVTGNRICLDGQIRNNPWAYLDYLVYAHIDSYKTIYELVAEKCPPGFAVRDTYNRYNPPSVTERASPVILLLTLTNNSHDVFELQDFFKAFKTDGRCVRGC